MESSSSHYYDFVACLCNAFIFIAFSVGLDKPLTASTCSFYFGFVGLGMGMVEAIYNCSTTKKFFWMTATTFMIQCGTEEYMGDSVLYIREPKIAECSKNARICNILLEIFHFFLFFTKKLLFHIRVCC
jgi:hypothetical protein